MTIGPQSTPSLPRHIKLRHDASRDRWVLLAPEKVLSPNGVAVEILKLCDGRRTVEDIAQDLAKRFTAPPEQIRADVLAMVNDLAGKGVLKA
jgi:pyrroloquinoline quinone biosynthesis protein D